MDLDTKEIRETHNLYILYRKDPLYRKVEVLRILLILLFIFFYFLLFYSLYEFFRLEYTMNSIIYFL